MEAGKHCAYAVPMATSLDDLAAIVAATKKTGMNYIIVSSGALYGLITTFIGPMVYDYMRRSQMGTINAGSNMMTQMVAFLAANLGAWWVIYYSTHFPIPAGMKYEYSSIYLLLFVLFVPIILARYILFMLSPPAS